MTAKAADSNDYVSDVQANTVTIKGFSIYSATDTVTARLYLDRVSNCTIKDNRCG